VFLFSYLQKFTMNEALLLIDCRIQLQNISLSLTVQFVDPYYALYGKGKAIPLQALTGSEGSRRLNLPDFQDSWYMKVARLSALRTGHLYPRKHFWYSFLLEAESTRGP
jgi:hypothetical protein